MIAGLRGFYPVLWLLYRIELIARYFRHPNGGMPTRPSIFESNRAWFDLRVAPHYKTTLCNLSTWWECCILTFDRTLDEGFLHRMFQLCKRKPITCVEGRWNNRRERLGVMKLYRYRYPLTARTKTESYLRCPRGVMVKAMNCGIVVREFVLQSRYYVHFRANTLGKGMNPLILPPAMGK